MMLVRRCRTDKRMDSVVSDLKCRHNCWWLKKLCINYSVVRRRISSHWYSLVAISSSYTKRYQYFLFYYAGHYYRSLFFARSLLTKYTQRRKPRKHFFKWRHTLAHVSFVLLQKRRARQTKYFAVIIDVSFFWCRSMSNPGRSSGIPDWMTKLEAMSRSWCNSFPHRQAFHSKQCVFAVKMHMERSMRNSSEHSKECKKSEKWKSTIKRVRLHRMIGTIHFDRLSEIPISIYTPSDVTKDKLVVFFHGGGKRWRPSDRTSCIEWLQVGHLPVARLIKLLSTCWRSTVD